MIPHGRTSPGDVDEQVEIASSVRLRIVLFASWGGDLFATRSASLPVTVQA